jgi:glycosyltransferase involved in cell wall biosynthesis/GT2 family glycosyltransferase
MKIAIFSEIFYPEMSGMSDSVIAIAKGLAAKGHRVNFYVPRHSRRDFSISKLPYRELDLGENIHIIRLVSVPYAPASTKQGRLVLPIFSSYRSVKDFDPDVIYTQDFFGAGTEALLLSKILKKPLIGTSHTPIAEFLKYSPIPIKIRMRWLERVMLKYVSWYYNQCRLVTAPSSSILSEMKEYGFKKRGLVLSNPVDTSLFTSVASLEEKIRLKKKYGLSQHTLLYTGRLAQEKNIDVVLRAMAVVKKTIPDISFAITGHGAALVSLKNLAKKLGVEKSVSFFGYLEHKEFSEVYRASDIFAVMSTAETQCLSMMHAFASGLPAIGADAYGLPEYIPKDTGFVVPPGDIQGLADKILFLFSHPEERKRFGENGKKFVQNFSVSRVVDEWEKIFQSLLEKQTQRKDLTLSFVIPAYNEERYIGACLASVLEEVRRAAREVEIVVVNNASADRTKEVALSFAGVKVVDEPQKGLTMARRAGFFASSGDLIANVDADTKLPGGWLTKVFREFSREDDLVALSGPYIYYDLPFFARHLVQVFYGFGYVFHRINSFFKKGAMIQGGNYVVKRSAMEKIGGYDTHFDFYGEDTNIAVRIRTVGMVKWDFHLPMYTSARRLKGEGLFKAGFWYALTYFWTTVSRKPFVKKYRGIR